MIAPLLLASRLVDRDATDIKALVAKYGSYRKASAALGVPRSTLFDLVRRGVAFGWRQHLKIGKVAPRRRRQRESR